MALFLARAREMRRQLVVDDDTTALVEEVCRSLDGLPLAIELAAARVRSLSVRDIARRLDDRFSLLQDPSSHRPERRRALAGAIGWSYDLLFPDDQRGLWALSCFAGSASLAAVEHVLVALEVPAGAVVDTLTRLVDRSLVSVDSTDDGQVRYRLLDSIRAYAADRLADAGLTETAHRAHAALVRADGRLVRGARPGQEPTGVPGDRARREGERGRRTHVEQDQRTGPRCPPSRPGSGGPGSSSATARPPPPGSATTLTSATPPSARASALLLAGWLEASAGDVALAQR